MKTYLEDALKIKDDIVGIRRKIHQNPEVGRELPKTKAIIIETLKSYGIEPKDIIESGVTATIGKPGGKTILLRADMDALPMPEYNEDLEFRSQEENKMHACGHDIHTSMLLGTAKILKERESELEGQVKFMFQPDEEGLSGAKAMIEEGILENPKVDVAMGMHVFPGFFDVPAGSMLITPGPIMAGQIRFRINVIGVGCHGALPETGVDPINIGVQIYNAITTIKMREIPAMDPCVITIGQFEFGSTGNIIPDTGVIEGSIRFMKNEVGDLAYKRIGEISNSIAKVMGGTAEVSMPTYAPSCTNDPALTNEIKGYIEETIGADMILPFEFQVMGSEDFAFISNKVPSVFVALATGSPKEGYKYPVHNPNVRFDEDAIPYGISAYVASAINWLKNNK